MSRAEVRLIRGDCLVEMVSLPDSSVGLIIADPPYHRVKDEAWDRRWKTDADYLDWIGRLCDELGRVLRPNGSLYLFASPRMAARVECKVGEAFEVLNQIVWDKGDGSGAEKGARGGLTRSYIYQTERIIFAEQFGADNAAKGEAGWVAKCDELRGFVFEPLRAYLAGERDRAGFTTRQVAEAFQRKTGSRTVTGMAGHWFERSQWELPTVTNYEWLRGLFNQGGDEYLRRDYDDLRRDYDDLREQYESLRRPFSVDSSVSYTDVWDFPTVPHRPGKHPCQKPENLISHIIRASSRPGDLVLDPFAGSGVTGRACLALGRPAVLIEEDPAWCGRIAAMLGEGESSDTPLFSGLAS